MVNESSRSDIEERSAGYALADRLRTDRGRLHIKDGQALALGRNGPAGHVHVQLLVEVTVVQLAIPAHGRRAKGKTLPKSPEPKHICNTRLPANIDSVSTHEAFNSVGVKVSN